MDTRKETYAVLRIWKATLKVLKLVAALSGESMIALMDRLARQELARIQDAERNQD